MIKEETIELIDKAVEVETENACMNWGDKYNSVWEAYAVLKEEVEETNECMELAETSLAIIWNYIKRNNNTDLISDRIAGMKEHVKNLIAEACQIEAVLNKFENTLEGKK